MKIPKITLGKLSGWKRAYIACLLSAGAVASQGQTFQVLWNFEGTDGSRPESPLIQGLAGNLNGTTLSGGGFEAGTVFRISPQGMLTTLHTFGGGPDGSSPTAGLVQVPSGGLYGTTTGGGAYNQGVVFRITSAGAFTTLYSFCAQANCTDGALPLVGLAQGMDGNFYGTTYSGGANGYGTIFKITANGLLTTLHSFDGTDGANPYAALIQGTDGNFYGTTLSGGSNGVGTVFKVTPGGIFSTLHSFVSTDGSNPNGALVQATDGNFYGATEYGGANGGGTVFKMSRSGRLTTLYAFCSQADCADGAFPNGLIQANDGNFYGTAAIGGSNNDGTIFEITPAGVETTLHAFASRDGFDVFAPLVQDTDGVFYGTASAGGAYFYYGTVFSLSTGLPPFVSTLPSFGKVGASVKLLGTTLTGATSVTFNGTPATFTVVSPTLIKTTVPTGATTGKVQVVTPSGTLTSNTAFRVR